ncbi:prolyl endopeptidase-like protein [Tanacetum coccineum]
MRSRATCHSSGKTHRGEEGGASSSGDHPLYIRGTVLGYKSQELKERIKQAKEKSGKDRMFTLECEFRDEMMAVWRDFCHISRGDDASQKLQLLKLCSFTPVSIMFAYMVGNISVMFKREYTCCTGDMDHLSVHPRFLYKGRLEDPESEEVKEFVKKQVELTEFVLKKCEMRERLHDKLIKSYEYPNFGASFREAEKYFYFHNSGLQPQKVMYMQVYMVVELCGEIKDGLEFLPEVFENQNRRRFWAALITFLKPDCKPVWTEAKRGLWTQFMNEGDEFATDEAYDRRKQINLLWAVKDAAMCAVSDKEKWRRTR